MSRRGKKSKSCHEVAQKEIKVAKLSRQKHVKRSHLINTLYMHASSFPQKLTVSTLWDNHKQINDIVTQLISLESELKVPLPNRTPESIRKLEAWAKENGVVMNDVKISEFEGYDFGLRATEDIAEGSVIVSVPKKLMITIDSIKGSPMETIYNEDVVLQQFPNVALAMFILVERFKSGSSFWSSYFSALPSSYTTCVYFSLDDLNELKGSPALEYSLKMYKNITRQYAYFWSIFQKNTDEASEILRDTFTFEQYRWAVSTVMTRQNYIPCADRIPVNVIIPVWDFCNHANNKRPDDTEPSTTYNVESESCVCVAAERFVKGDQINIFYGERSNADFLVHNGFVYAENRHDTVKVKFGISHSDSCLLRLALLKKLKLPPSGEYLIKADSQHPIHSSVLAFVRIFKMNEDQLREWLDREDAERELLAAPPVASLGEQFDGAVLQYIQTRITILLKAYPTTIQQDEQLVREHQQLNQDQENARHSSSKIRQLVIAHRITEKVILNKAVEYCKLKMSQINLQQLEIR